MFVKLSLLASNPFYDAFYHSDLLGKCIFIILIFLSFSTWAILIYKVYVTYQAKNKSIQFHKTFKGNESNLLSMTAVQNNSIWFSNPFLSIYSVTKRHTIDILNKNRRFGGGGDNNPSYLSPTDIDVVESHLISQIAREVKHLESYLWILSTVVPLAPFLGLLGTVWGILTSFSHMQQGASGSTNQMVIGGLSLALATTVIGLVDAIPALIGYNYLKNLIGDFATDMECFANEILATVEMQYRKVDIN